jgi:hypothetical protein
VQAAVDQGGDVVLSGHFSFDAPPNAINTVAKELVPIGLPAHAEVKITRAVSITGGGDEEDDLATIEGGAIPFYIEAPGQAVTIRRLHFVRPTSHAVLVFAVRGLEITSNRVEGVKTFNPSLNGAVSVLTGAIPNPTKPARTGNVTGKILIADNDFDLSGGTTAENVLGLTVFSVGDSATPVDIHVTGNRIRNTTEPAINFRRAVGTVVIDHNEINTGVVGVPDARNQVIRVANLGSYTIAHNRIDCRWPITDCEGIGVFSQFANWTIAKAVVEHNEIIMSAPGPTAFSAFSAGIGVYGFARDNIVRHNRIRGRALAGISIPEFPVPPAPPATPQDNQFVHNVFVAFKATDADFFVGAHALDTRIVGRGTVDNQSSSTILVRGGPEARE